LLGAAVTAAIAIPPFAGLAANRMVGATATPDLSKIRFLAAERYVRADTAGDLAANLVTYNATTQVHFIVDGDTENPIAGSDFGAQGKNFHQWRLTAGLAAGKHTITAKVEIGDTWYDATGTVTAYSLDMPTASYVFPNAQRSIFRSGDNPLRVKVDDEFDQLKNVSYSIYHYDTATNKIGDHVGTFKVDRADCDLRQAGNYVLCDAAAADGWTPLTDDGAYIAKLTTNSLANNGVRTAMKDYWTQFYIDDTKPAVTDLQIDGQATVKDSLAVSANAADSTNLESVYFYVTAPRSDGECVGNGDKLAEQRVTAAGDDGRYHAMLDVSGIDTHGQPAATYCVTAIARDDAMNNSDLSSLHFAIDHRAPIVAFTVTSSKTPSASTPVMLAGTVDDAATLELFKDGTKVDDFSLTMTAAGQWSYRLDNGLEKGDHVLKVVATDGLGNASSEVSSPESFVNITASAYIPPQAVSHLSKTLAPPQLPQNPVVPTATFTQIVASQSHPTVAAKNLNSPAILGAETSKDQTSPSPVESIVAPSSGGWMLLGFAWYWWLLALAIVGGVASWLAAGVKASAREIA
jgi:hypothetical protein